MIKVNRVVANNYLEENCYILEQDGAYLIIDPGCNYEELKSYLDCEVEGILITHHHFDHVTCLDELKKNFDVPVLDFAHFVEHFKTNHFSFSMIETKGHSKDSVTFYFEKEKILFTGDFLFQGSIGRCDLEGGNVDEMMKSLEKIMTYPDDLIVYPGHGESTTLKEEKMRNPYLVRLQKNEKNDMIGK